MPPRGDSRLKTPLIAGNYLHLINYNVTGNGERECLKIIRLVQSAAKTHILLYLNKYVSNVQRLSKGESTVVRTLDNITE